MNKLTILATALWCATGAFAQEGPNPSSDQSSRAFLRMRSDDSGWRANWNKATGTPKQVFGPGLPVSGKVDSVERAQAIARDVLRQYADLLGLGTSEFDVEIATKVAQTYVLVYGQSFRGLEVLGGRADVRLHQSGVVSMFGSKAVAIEPGFGVEPFIAAAAALEFAQRELDVATDSPNAPRLVIHADVEGASPAQPLLCWECPIDSRDTGKFIVGRAYVNAKTGELVEFQDDVYTCALGHTHVAGELTGDSRLERARSLSESLRAARVSSEAPADALMSYSGNVRGWVNTTSNNLSATTNVPLPGVLVTVPGVGSTFTDENGDFDLPSASTASASVTVSLVGRHLSGMTISQGSAVTDTQTVTPGTPAQFQLSSAGDAEFNRSQLDVYWWIDQTNEYMRSILGNTGPLNQISNVSADVNIASSCNATYGGLRTRFFASGGGCNNTGFSTVVAHELGHGMDDVHGGISQTDGLSEAWGDTIAIFLTGQPVVGQGFSGSGGIVRTALNSRTYPAGGFPAGGAPHPKGEVFMGFNWTVRQNLINALGVTAGTARAEDVVIGSIVADATNQPDAVFEIFVLDDDDGNINNGTANYTQLVAAANQRNLPFPEIQVGTISANTLATTTELLTPRQVTATVVPLQGSFNSIDLVFNLGAGEVRRPMIATGVTNQFRALIDGNTGPGSVSYRVEAAHSTGQLLTFPESGDLSYSVGNDIVVFSDGFETDLGWVSQQIATQNDWQRGVPNGSSGTSSGVAWSDPSSAFSGANVYGNDLGPAGFNGAYQPNVSNSLTSPSINVAGQSGLKLRFRRWLTVEEGIFDQAKIFVNGVEVWANPVNGNLVDTSWTLFELPIPAFDGSATIQVAFTLESDGGLNLGGWNIDDFEVLAAGPTAGPAVAFRLSPPQVPLGGATLINVLGSPNAPAGIALSSFPGITPIPGFGELLVGSPFSVIAIQLDPAGAFQLLVPGPVNMGASGALFHLQVFELVGAGLQTSNRNLLLIGN